MSAHRLSVATVALLLVAGGMQAVQAGEVLRVPDDGGDGAPRLVRIVDLPDVPALHWRGGRYKDLGYLFEADGTGQWVAYLGRNEYMLVSPRELRNMIRLAADTAASGAAAGQLAAATAETAPLPPAAAAAKADLSPQRNAAPSAGSSRTPATAGGTGAAITPGDELDAALLTKSAADLMTGSTTPAGSAEGVVSLDDEVKEPAMAPEMPPALEKPASAPVSAPAPASEMLSAENSERSSGGGWWMAGLLIPLVLAAGAMAFLGIRRRQAGKRLRDRMASVTGAAREDGSVNVNTGNEPPADVAEGAVAESAVAEGAAAPRKTAATASRVRGASGKDRRGVSLRREKKAPAAARERTAGIDPAELMRAMQVAASGGLR
jgi:hypothetical protein